MKEFQIRFRDDALVDLRQRIRSTRIPTISGKGDWSLGTDSSYLSSLLDYWCSSYDWLRKERELNQYPQFTSEIDGLTIHFFHIR